jgi:hypothetical protein
MYIPAETKHPEGAAPDAGEVKERGAAGYRPRLSLRFDFPLLVFKVEDGAPLRVVQRGRPVERPANGD